MGLSTGIDLEALVDIGEYICNILKKPTQSKVARAIVAKRANDEA
jgi:hydroxymethylglutaryl-CoA lyase